MKLPAAGKCVKGRKLRVKLHEPAGVEIVKATLRVDGKRKATAPDAKTVVLRKLPMKMRFTVSVQVVTADDGTLTGKRRYKACT